MCYICMFRYSAIYINIVSFVISIIIFLIVNLFLSNMYIFTTKGIFKISFKVNNGYIQRNSNYVEDTNIEKIVEEKVENKDDEWYLEIPCINLKANIKEGTTKEIMEDYIGHFEETKKDIGNIGLAAHNRGYKNNYFQNLKELKQNDEIYYKYKNEKRKYVVIKNIIIKDTDWTNLEESDGNIITLITCVENQPEYRRCVQGKEKIEEREDF
jgi:LPXTG-site transpeptidase (sortase) family protein